MDNNLKRELIIDNFENPFHKEVKESQEFIKANTHNESCIDNIDLYVKINDDIIVDAYFDGEACAITTSATSIMLKNIIGKSINEARELMTEYYHMIEEENYKENSKSNPIDIIEKLKNCYNYKLIFSQIKIHHQ